MLFLVKSARLLLGKMENSMVGIREEFHGVSFK